MNPAQYKGVKSIDAYLQDYFSQAYQRYEQQYQAQNQVVGLYNLNCLGSQMTFEQLVSQCCKWSYTYPTQLQIVPSHGFESSRFGGQWQAKEGVIQPWNQRLNN